MPRDLSVVKPRSFCPECNQTIAWFDNIPLLSYALLAGRCRRCGHRIPVRYPVVELLTGVLFFCAFWFLGTTLAAAKFAVFGAIMIALVFSDLEERILPDEFTLGGTAAGRHLRGVRAGERRNPAADLLFRPRTSGWSRCATRCWPRQFAPARYGRCARSMRRSATAKGWDWAT